jgi:hypothetical protein
MRTERTVRKTAKGTPARPPRTYLVVGGILLGALVVGQLISFLVQPDSWRAFIDRFPVIVSMLFFWGPIIAIVAAGFDWAVLSLLGFHSLKEIRDESVEQNNPAPAITFVGTLIASILFLMMVIRP